MHQNLPLRAYVNAIIKESRNSSTYVVLSITGITIISNLAIIEEKLPNSRTWDR